MEEALKWIRSSIEGAVPARTMLVMVFLFSTILIFLPGGALRAFKIDEFVGVFGQYLGVAAVGSGLLLLAMAATAVSNGLHSKLRYRKLVKSAESSCLDDAHHALLHFLMRRHPSCERLVDEHPAVFRLWQLGLIEKVDSLIYVLPDPCSSYRLTDPGQTYALRHQDGTSHLRQAELEELIHAMTGKRFRLLV